MKLAKMQVHEFANVLASDEPAPGGGSTAALEGALGAALTAMVCGLTENKKGYEENRNLLVKTRMQIQTLQEALIDVMDRDTEAFCAVADAYAMPKRTEEEKANRSAAIQKGLLQCTKTPLEAMDLSVQCLELTDGMLGSFNESAASDLGVAALSLRTAVQGAWLNVLINIGSLKDRAVAEDCREKGQLLLQRATQLSDRIYTHILNLIQ